MSVEGGVERPRTDHPLSSLCLRKIARFKGEGTVGNRLGEGADFRECTKGSTVTVKGVEYTTTNDASAGTYSLFRCTG